MPSTIQSVQNNLPEVKNLEIAKCPIIPDNRPSDYIHVLMSSHAYQGSSLKVGDTLPEADNWKIAATRHGESEYFGVLYFNRRYNHYVLAHQNTNSLAAWVEDFKGIYFGKISPQEHIVKCRFHNDKYEGANWAMLYFGNPFIEKEGADKKFKQLEMIRNHLTAFLVYEHEEGQWRFVHESYKDLLANINLVEITELESKISKEGKKEQRRGKSIEEFSRLLFEDLKGPYLTGKQEWIVSVKKRF